MNLDLTGRTALVTGSTRGIGLATAKGLATMGAKVIVNGRGEDAVKTAVAAVDQAAGAKRATGIAADLAGAAGCGEVIAQHPDVDILVNSLGVYAPTPFFEIPDDEWQLMFDANVMSGVRLTRHYLKRMVDGKDWGRVIFVSSESAVFVPKEMVHYGVSKGAQLVIARGAAEYTKGTNVTVNSVMPGPTWVEAQTERLTKRAAEQGTTLEDLKSRTFTERRPASLLQRYATPEEIANMICYLCSPAASATNGAALRVDGGIVTNPF